MNQVSVDNWFAEKISLMSDPYFDREFFTNLIFCMDRKKTIREIFSASVAEFNQSPQFSEEFDRSLYHLYTCYQASQFIRESYQFLPLAQGIYTAALYRSNGRKPIERKPMKKPEARGSSIEDFEKSMIRGARRVIPFEQVWEALIFLLQNRSTRSKAIEILVKAGFEEGDELTTCLLTKALDICFASGWKDIDIYLYRPFLRFWKQTGLEAIPENLSKAQALVDSMSTALEPGRGVLWPEEWAEELWFRASKQGAESAWEWIDQISQQGASLDQVESAVQLLFGRCLFAMRAAQWGSVSEAILVAESAQAAGRWSPASRKLYVATALSELSRIAQVAARDLPARPTGGDLQEKFSMNLAKNQLILRLDDAIETGEGDKALNLAALLIRDRGLSHTLSDRLVLMAAKQDAWNYSMMTLPVSMFLANTYEAALRLQIPQAIYQDVVFGLLRFFLIQREVSLAQVKKQGHYGDGGLEASHFDVSGGARIVDRYVFNQMRNGQRIFVWPTEAKG